jgi:hypothetical protein
VVIPTRGIGVLHYAANEEHRDRRGPRLVQVDVPAPKDMVRRGGLMQQTTVIEELPLHLVIPGQPGVPMSAELRYVSTDPYAVHATFRAEGSQVTWVVSRELLMTGLQAVSGIGDVTVRPCPDHPETVVLIQLSSPDGVAVLAAGSADLRGFLLRTCDQVAPGAEGAFLARDLKLAELLA